MVIEVTRDSENPSSGFNHRHSTELGQFDLEFTEPWLIVHEQSPASSFILGSARALYLSMQSKLTKENKVFR